MLLLQLLLEPIAVAFLQPTSIIQTDAAAAAAAAAAGNRLRLYKLAQHPLDRELVSVLRYLKHNLHF